MVCHIFKCFSDLIHKNLNFKVNAILIFENYKSWGTIDWLLANLFEKASW